MTTLTLHVNTDTDDEVLGASGVEWTEISPANDNIIFTAGNPTVADGQPIPSSFELSQAGIELDGTEKIVDTYLLSDLSANELKQIHNMGNVNKRYVLAFAFDGATTSEPKLEAWDNTDFDTVSNVVLGSGTPSSSFLRGITTTDALPGVDWTGSRLAGAGAGNFLNLNNGNGALSVATTLYANLKLVFPASQTESGSEVPIIVCKYTTI